MKKPLFLALALAFFSSARAGGLPDLGEAAQADFTPAMERRYGEAAMREIRRDPAYLEDDEIDAYVGELGSRLVAAAATAQDFQFFVVRDPTLNAFAMPGGFVGVHSGLILAARSESELASVLAHEIAHVTQRHLARLVSKDKQLSVVGIAGAVAAILAARSGSPDAAAAAMIGSQAALMQGQINFTREYEREADRLGFQTLEKAHFDVHAMSDFFGRLQQSGRLYENNAPSYLRTHPLTVERISDMQNRSQESRYRQTPSSIEFHLVRAKLRAAEGTAREASEYFSKLLQERKYDSEAGARYGHVRALLRAGDLGASEREYGKLRATGAVSPMVDLLGAEIRQASGDVKGALAALGEARRQYPDNRPLLYGEIASMLRGNQAAQALQAAEDAMRLHGRGARLLALTASAHTALGNALARHRTLAELHMLRSEWRPAVEQLELARRAGGNFYEQSQVDARLREARQQLKEEERERKH